MLYRVTGNRESKSIRHIISPGISPGLLLQYSFRSTADHVVHALDEVVTVVTLYTWMHGAALGLSGRVVHEKTHLHRSRSFQMPLGDDVSKLDTNVNICFFQGLAGYCHPHI